MPGELLSSGLPVDIPGDSLGVAFLVIAGIVMVALVLIPVLLFGIELVALGCVLAATVAARILLGRPWTVEARTAGAGGSQRVLEWSVPGWRRSGKVIDAVTEDLVAGRTPDPAPLAPGSPD